MADGMEFKRAKAPAGDELTFLIHYRSAEDWPRPKDPAPDAAAPETIREDWSGRFVPWYFSQTGGEIEIPDVPAGQRWRMEYFECVADPQTFEQYAEHEIRVYQLKESGHVEGK